MREMRQKECFAQNICTKEDNVVPLWAVIVGQLTGDEFAIKGLTELIKG